MISLLVNESMVQRRRVANLVINGEDLERHLFLEPTILSKYLVINDKVFRPTTTVTPWLDGFNLAHFDNIDIRSTATALNWGCQHGMDCVEIRSPKQVCDTEKIAAIEQAMPYIAGSWSSSMNRD
jgi:hypothetical protein